MARRKHMPMAVRRRCTQVIYYKSLRSVIHAHPVGIQHCIEGYNQQITRPGNVNTTDGSHCVKALKYLSLNELLFVSFPPCVRSSFDYVIACTVVRQKPWFDKRMAEQFSHNPFAALSGADLPAGP